MPFFTRSGRTIVVRMRIIDAAQIPNLCTWSAPAPRRVARCSYHNPSTRAGAPDHGSHGCCFTAVRLHLATHSCCAVYVFCATHASSSYRGRRALLQFRCDIDIHRGGFRCDAAVGPRLWPRANANYSQEESYATENASVCMLGQQA